MFSNYFMRSVHQIAKFDPIRYVFVFYKCNDQSIKIFLRGSSCSNIYFFMKTHSHFKQHEILNVIILFFISFQNNSIVRQVCTAFCITIMILKNKIQINNYPLNIILNLSFVMRLNFKNTISIVLFHIHIHKLFRHISDQIFTITNS